MTWTYIDGNQARERGLLVGRLSRCSPDVRVEGGGGHNEHPSTDNLGFFEFRGDGSRAASLCKNCRYHEVAHHDIHPETGRDLTGNKNICKTYEPHGAWDFDTHWCGCGGTD